MSCFYFDLMITCSTWKKWLPEKYSTNNKRQGAL